MLCSLVYRNTFLIDFKESKMQLQDSQSKLPNQTILLPFCTHSIGCQSQLEFSTKYPPSVTVLCQIPVLNICPGSCGFIHHRDNSVRPATTAFFVFPPSKQKPLVKSPFHMLVLWSGTNFHMTSGVHSQKPHSSKPSKPICLARTTSLTVFVLFATPVAGWVSRLGYIFRAPSPSPIFCRFWSVLLAAVLLLAAFACFVVVVVVVLLYAVLLWSASSPNEMGRSRSPLYYYHYYYYYYHF